MTFIKDILIIDFETTGLHPDRDLPIQLAAVLLDKETLEEKKTYTTFIKQDLSSADPEAMAVNGIKQQDLDSAPSEAEVARALVETFGFDVLLASWVEFLDRRMLERILKTADVNIRTFDYHFLDLWHVAYVHLLKQGYAGTIRSEAMFEALGLPKRGSHDALEDCRHAAEALRIILK
jgi:DNA polymerase III epsilon subunit-like protein